MFNLCSLCAELDCSHLTFELQHLREHEGTIDNTKQQSHAPVEPDDYIRVEI